MSSPMRDQFEQAYADFERSYEAILKAEAEVRSTSSTVTSKNQAVAVTVDGNGEVTEIKFRSDAYRSMPPAELGALLVEVISEGRRKSLQTTAGQLQNLLPADLSALSMFSGDMSLEKVMHEMSKRTGGGVE